jgi:hypothetical protein
MLNMLNMLNYIHWWNPWPLQFCEPQDPNLQAQKAIEGTQREWCTVWTSRRGWSMLIQWTSCRYFAQKMSLGHRYCRRQTIPQKFTVDTVGICRLCMAVPQNSWHTNLYKASKLSSKMPIDANYVLEVNVRDLPALGQCGGVKKDTLQLSKVFLW